MRKQSKRAAIAAALMSAGTTASFMFTAPPASAETPYRSAVETCVRSSLPDRKTFDECVDDVGLPTASAPVPKAAPAAVPSPVATSTPSSAAPLLKGTVTSGADQPGTEPVGLDDGKAAVEAPSAPSLAVVDQVVASESSPADLGADPSPVSNDKPVGASVPPPASQPASSAPAGDWVMAALARLRECEASGDYGANTGNGYYGAYQFSLKTWQSLGFDGYPNQAPASVQDEAAVALQARDGWSSWPACARRLGLG